MNFTVLIFLVAILIVGTLVFLMVFFRKSGGAALNKQEFQAHWLEIEHSVKQGEPATYQLAILNADKLVDKALRDTRTKGATMGERMKSAQARWSNANAIWTAHKVRNKLAHETNAKVPYELTKQSLKAFKQALKDLGAI